MKNLVAFEILEFSKMSIQRKEVLDFRVFCVGKRAEFRNEHQLRQRLSGKTSFGAGFITGFQELNTWLRMNSCLNSSFYGSVTLTILQTGKL